MPRLLRDVAHLCGVAPFAVKDTAKVCIFRHTAILPAPRLSLHERDTQNPAA